MYEKTTTTATKTEKAEERIIKSDQINGSNTHSLSIGLSRCIYISRYLRNKKKRKKGGRNNKI
jgi:hypothetical protein